MKNKTDLIGLEAVDKITKIKGVIINYADYLHQGARVDLQPSERKSDGSILDSIGFDLCQLEISKKRIINTPKFFKTDISLSDKVQCKITGYKGTVVGKSYYINGCVSLLVQKEYDYISDKEYNRGTWIPADNLKVTKKSNQEVEEKTTGGPGDVNRPKMRNF